MPNLAHATQAAAVPRAVAPRSGPALPVLIGPEPAKPRQFADLAALARHIHALRGPRGGLEIGGLTHASQDGCAPFPAFNLYRLAEDDGARTWLGLVAIQADSADRLRAALNAALPQGETH